MIIKKVILLGNPGYDCLEDLKYPVELYTPRPHMSEEGGVYVTSPVLSIDPDLNMVFYFGPEFVRIEDA